MKHFNESLSTAVFTTKYIINENSPILYVFHDEDGSWQFHGPENEVSEEDIRIIALEEAITIDNSILEIADMPKGYEAIRDVKANSWRVKKSL